MQGNKYKKAWRKKSPVKKLKGLKGLCLGRSARFKTYI
ncbi:hypothetical protein PCARR_a1613 [Pseudoalteromonas carrageenovora IAM 12662]|uniref:Uncharacterized protein n=1 Tax=Pseudoalteromonas carrageenovora IAM 12662 TaxID=1314868 RepID=A0ABR9ETE9_PSEVC|nr:hypothetical protein [Pseudoalteromonas carrageenovora IAM 12662]